jgi:methionine biosynthesis protein MetW
MPVSKFLPYEWFNTPNVRVLTIADFEALAHKLGIDIMGRVVLHEGKVVQWVPNLLGSLAIYRVRGTQ